MALQEVSFPFLNATHETSLVDLTVSFTDPCNWPYRLLWNSSCFINDPLYGFPVNGLYLDTEFEPIDYDEKREGRENGFGQKKYTYQSMDRIFKMKVVTDDTYYDILKKMRFNTDIKLINQRSGSEFEIEDVEVERENTETFFDYVTTISFKIKNSTVETTGCDCGAYANAPFESDCNDDALEPRSNDDVCLGFDATIGVAGNILTVTTSGGPSNAPTYKWYYDGGTGAFQLLSGSAQSIAMGGYGTYRSIVQKGSCQVQKDHLNQDPCNGLTVSLSKSNTSITANVIGCESPTYLWSFVDSEGVESALPSTGQTIVATQTGNYKVHVGCGACSREAIIFVEVTNQQTPECSGKSVSVSRSGDSLTASVTGCTDSLLISWIKIGEGNVTQNLPTTGPTVPIDGNGVYKVTATCGNCTMTSEYVVIECDVACNVSMQIAKSGDTLIATVNGCNESSVITWYKNTGSGNGSALGVGASIGINGNGMYKAEVTCGDCTAEAYFMVFDCVQCTVAVSLAIDNNQINATITGCVGTCTNKWYRNIGQGNVEIAQDQASITATLPGLYTIIVTDGNCTAEAGIIFLNDCPNCTPVTTGVNGSINVCD